MADFPPTRASLLVRLRDSRDEAAWREFVELYAPLVYGYACKRGLQDADAADLCQDVLRAVAGAIGRLNYDPARGAFRNWLFTIVRRKLGNRQAKQAARGSGDTGIQDLLEQTAAAEEQTWERDWERQMFAWACTRVRAEVSAATWQAFWRTAVDSEPCQRVAAELGMTPGAVYLGRSRVFARLKKQVQAAAQLEEE